MPKAKEEAQALNNLVHLFGIDVLKIRKELDELKEEVRLSSLQSDAQRNCIKVQADLINHVIREENIWRERMRKALNYANFQTEMQAIKTRDEDQPF